MTISPSAFDAFAADYDQAFTHTPLGRLLRPRVWASLADQFAPGSHLLELACGTGEDAAWLAAQGRQITATDAAPEMVEHTRHKAARRGVSEQVTAVPVSLQAIIAGYFDGRLFDGVFSNFGGLNTINLWADLAAALAHILKPGGKVVLVPMGPFCPWEIGWFGLHGQWRNAVRRLRPPAEARIGEQLIPIWYPSAGQLKKAFAPYFRHRRTESLGLWLPPSYLDQVVDKWPNLFHKLNNWEQWTARLSRSWGDHYIIIFEKET